MVARKHEELRREVEAMTRKCGDEADAIMAGKTAIADARERSSKRGGGSSIRHLIMVVEDEDSHRDMIEGVLRSIVGIRVVTFANALEALRELVLHAKDYTVVVTDVSMPGMDGVAFARRIRDVGVDLPVILVTGTTDAPGRDRAMRAAGAVAAFGKPVDVGGLQDAVRKLVGASLAVGQ